MTVVLLSGGIDSTVLVSQLLEEREPVIPLFVNYGQRHIRERGAALAVAEHHGLVLRVIDVPTLASALPGSALTDTNVSVPLGHYAAPTMRATVVPNRNAILCSIAAAVAIAEGDHVVAFAAHSGDHFIYPDCRPRFIRRLQRAFRAGNQGLTVGRFRLAAPFLRIAKADIVTLGAHLDSPLGLTWSCYVGGSVHCGECGTCTERREAFALAGIADPTVYA